MTGATGAAGAAMTAPIAQPLSGTALPRWRWGMLPFLTLTSALGLVLVAIANRAAADNASWAMLPFYVGLLIIVLPTAARLLTTAADGTERVSLVALLGLALFLCKTVHDPLRMGAYDEWLHLRTAEDMLATSGIFAPNTLLGVSPYYPGLELVTTALSNASGLPVFESGIVILFGARLVFVMSLFFFFAMASGSTRVAGIAALIYMVNPKFLYFNASFAYESLALPLAALLLYVLARRGHSGPTRWLGLTVIALVTLPSIVVTHHVTSAMLAGFLVLWAAVNFVMGRRDRARPTGMAVLLIALIAGWTLLVATATIGYLAPALTSTLSEVLRLALGEYEPRELFVSRAGDVAPLWERLLGSASAALTIVLIVPGLLVVWRRHRSNVTVMTLALVACAFPLTLVARFTSFGSEVAGRTPEFLYLGVGMVVALALARLSFQGRHGVAQMAVAMPVLVVLVIGGVLVGLPPWARLPGPYLVSADGRSIESEGIAAAEWTEETLGPGNVMIADRVNRVLMSVYGRQTLVTPYETRVPVRNLYISLEVGPTQEQIVRAAEIEYLVADQRLTTGSPVVGHYFDRGETQQLGEPEPLDPAFLEKFDNEPDISRIFDSGNVRIYDVSALPARPR